MVATYESRGDVPVERPVQERTVQRVSWVPTVIGPGMVLGALGTIGIVVSMFLPWRTGSVYPSDIPVAFLWDRTTTSHEPSLLIVLIPLAVLLAIGAVLPMGAGVRLFAGVVTLLVVALFAFQLHRALDATGGGNLGDVLETGFYVAAIGGLFGLVSGFFWSGWTGLRTVDRGRYADNEQQTYT